MANPASIRPVVLGCVAVAVACAGLAGLALAEERQRYDGRHLEKMLLGYEISGVEERTGAPFRECIAPNGQTSFQFRGAIATGQVQFPDGRRACFSYSADKFTTQHCFVLEQAGALRLMGSAPSSASTRYRIDQRVPVSGCMLAIS